jgi:hypothetical protein
MAVDGATPPVDVISLLPEVELFAYLLVILFLVDKKDVEQVRNVLLLSPTAANPLCFTYANLCRQRKSPQRQLRGCQYTTGERWMSLLLVSTFTTPSPTSPLAS